MIQMLELGVKDITASIINIPKDLKNSIVIMNKQMRNREMEIKRKNLIEILVRLNSESNIG